MTSRFAQSSENAHVRPAADGESDVGVPRSVPPEPLLRIVPTHIDGHAILALVGEMDTSNSETVREAVARCLARRPHTLSLDLSGLTFCGGCGIRTLRWALHQAKADNVELHIVAPAPWLRRVLTAMQAHDLLAATSDPA
jgi:anti-anti-sigma factor